jgi:DNA polymerase I
LETAVSVDNPSTLEALCDKLGYKRQWVAFDLETRSDANNLEDWHPSSSIVSASLTFGPGDTWVIPLNHPHAPMREEWRSRMATIADRMRDLKLIGHNLKYDIRWVLSTTGVDLTRDMSWCTMAAAHLMDENGVHGLKALAVRELGVEDWSSAVDLSDASQVPWEDLAYYNALDTEATYALAMKQMEQLRDDPSRGRVMWYISRKADQVLTRIESRGMAVDLREVAERKEDAQQRKLLLLDSLDERVPLELKSKYVNTNPQLFETEPERLSWAPTSKFFKEYASLNWPVLEETAKKQPSWTAAVMKRLVHKGYEDAAEVLALRKQEKILNTYLTRWPDDVDRQGRLHPTYNVSRAVTGRLTCERPNLQQVPKELKPVFYAPGGLFGQADFSQIEVRLMAQLSGDPNLRQVYVDGRDVYRETGAHILNKAPEDLSDHERFTMKAVVLGFLYGMMPPSFVTYARDVFGITITLDEAETFRTGFFSQYPGVETYHERQRRLVRRHGYVDNLIGRRRHLPEVNSRDMATRWKAERQAINFPCQSMGSELMILGLHAMDEKIPHDRVRAVGTVHDSALLELAGDIADAELKWIGQIMVAPDLTPFGVDITVPLVVELEVGPRWGDVQRTITVSSKEQGYV